MRLFICLALLASNCATPSATAMAREQGLVQECLANAGADSDARRACIGAYARPCVNLNEANQTTGGMVACIEAERQQWIAIRDEEAAALRARETPSQIALLASALQQYEYWAQARCAYAASVYEGGSLARLVAATCLRDAAADFALELVGRYDQP